MAGSVHNLEPNFVSARHLQNVAANHQISQAIICAVIWELGQCEESGIHMYPRYPRCQAAFDATLGLFRRVQGGLQSTSQRHHAMSLTQLVMAIQWLLEVRMLGIYSNSP